MTTPYSYRYATGDGATTAFSFPFPYLSKSHIHAYVAGSEVSFSWANSSTLSIYPAPPAGVSVKIQRVTPKDAAPVVFEDGSTLSEDDLNDVTMYELYWSQETEDGVDESIEGAIEAAQSAEASAAAAQASADQAATATTFKQVGASAVGRSYQDKMREWVTVTDFTKGRADETAALAAAFAAGSVVRIPQGFALPVCNAPIPNGCTLIVDGVLQMVNGGPQGSAIISLPSGSAGQRIIGSGSINGNKANQSGQNWQMLIYGANCVDVQIQLATALQNYFPGSIDAAIDVGAIHFEGGSFIDVAVRLLSDYGREGIFLHGSADSTVHNSLTRGGADSWSGVQASGPSSARNVIDSVRSYYAGASGIGCDSQDSLVSSCLVYANTYQNGFNFGHSGQPSNGTTVLNCTSVNAGTQGTGTNDFNGFSVVNGTSDVQLIGCRAKGAYKHAFNVSSSATNVYLTRCKGSASVIGYGLSTFGAYVEATDCDFRGNTAGPYLRGTGSTEKFKNVRLTDDPMSGFLAINGIPPGTGATLTNGNIKSSMLPKIFPSNSASQTAQPFLKTVNDGSLVVDFMSQPGGGTGVRWQID